MPDSSATLSIPLSGPATLPAIAIDKTGNIIVAWTQETSGNTAIYLSRWRQSRWESLGSSSIDRGVSATRATALAPSVVIDSLGNPVIAWQDRTAGNDEIYYRRWDGSMWQELDGSATGGGVSRTNTGYSRLPSLALDANSSPVIAWEEHYGSRADVWVRHYAQSFRKHGWVDIGDHPGMFIFPAKLSAATHVALCLNPRGDPSVAWMDDETGPNQVYFRRWAAGRWEELAGSASNGGVSRSRDAAASVNLALDPSANPILSWKEGSGPGAVLRIKIWNGRQWEALGTAPSEPGTDPTWPCLALDAHSRPVLAYRAHDEVRVRRWSGKAWDLLGTAKWRSPPAYTLEDKRLLAFAAGANKACATWVETGSSAEIRVACFKLAD